MKRLLKWTFGGLVAIVVVVLLVVFVRFETWRDGVAKRVAEEGRSVVTEVGTVEYVSYGDGIPVLWLHGTPGGYDQVLATLKLSAESARRYRSIIPSRPGYLGTPLESGASVEQQSHLFRALLRHLGIQRVAVVGSSGGGPYALDFARRYPQMCSALVLISAVSMTSKRDPAPSVMAQVFGIPLGRDFGIWAVRDTFPRSIKHIGLADPVTRAYVDAMMESAIPTHRRQAGFENDWDNFQDLGWLHIEEIRAPTLVLHGTEDGNVPFEHARHSASRIDGAKLVTFEGYDHFIYITQRTAIAAEIDELLAQRSDVARSGQ